MKRLFAVRRGMSLYVNEHARSGDLVTRGFSVKRGCFLVIDAVGSGVWRCLLDDGRVAHVQSDMIALNCNTIG